MREVQIQHGAVRVVEAPGRRPIGSRQIRVELRASSINGADARVVRERTTALVSPGIEFAGVVKAIGDEVSEWLPGDRVMGLALGGGHADEVVADAELCLPVPEGLEWVEAGALCEAFATAHDALFGTAKLTLGERLLVTGAAGGVGLAALQLGIAAGAQVIASVRREELRAKVAELVPGVVVVAPDEAHAAGPYDVVLELVGAPGIPSAIASLARFGRIIVIGRSAGSAAQVELAELMAKRAVLTGSTLRHRSVAERAEALRRMADAVLPKLAERNFRVVVDSVYPLSEAPAAFGHFIDGGKLGKVVLYAD